MKGPIGLLFAKYAPVQGVTQGAATAKTVAEMPRLSQIGFFHLSA